MLNDMVFSWDWEQLFIADASIVAGTPAILLYDVLENKAYRLLHNHTSVQAKFAKPMVNGNSIDFPWPVGVDSIAVGHEYLYYAAIYDTHMWRVPISDFTAAALMYQGDESGIKPEEKRDTFRVIRL